MEKEEQRLEEEEAAETTPLVRKPRNGDDSKIIVIPDVDDEVSINGVTPTNGHIVSENGAENYEEQIIPAAEEQKIEEVDWVLENKAKEINGDNETEERDENGSETMNGEKNSENLVFHDKIEGVNPIPTFICKTLVLEDPARAKLDDSPLDLHNEHNGTSVINTQHEEIKGNGISSSNISPYICKTLILNDPAHIKLDDSSHDLHIEHNGTSVINTQHKEEQEIEKNGVSVSNISTYICKTLILDDASRINFDSSSLDLRAESNGTSVTNNQEIEENGISSSNVQPSGTLSEESITSYEPSKEIESAETDVVDEDDLEITELDVERVIKKQTTHDLFCPNCKSCITKRVILSKRKRRIRIPAEDVKRPKTETARVPDLATVSTQTPEDDAQISTIDEDERERGPDIFRCLSCFSIFIPTGDGFFRIFGGRSGKENVRNEQAPNVKKNWFADIFKPNKQETVFQQASYSAIPSDPAHQSGEPSVVQDTGSEGHEGTTVETGRNEGGDKSRTIPNQKPSVNGVVGKLDIKATTHLVENAVPLVLEEVHIGQDSFLPTTLPMKTEEQLVIAPLIHGGLARPLTQVTNMEYAEDGISFAKQDGSMFMINSNNESAPIQNSNDSPKLNQLMKPQDKDVVHPSPPSVSAVQASDVDGTLNISVSIPHEEQDVTATIVTTSLLENKSADSKSSDNGEIEVPQQLITTQTFDFHHDEPLRTGITSAVVDAPPGQGNDTRITIDTHPPETQISTADRERSAGRQERKIEVIKSIVYGGLAESITSLSVIASAAGGGAATLNVLAMGAANLVGGLFIISHNLWDLRCDRVEEQLSNQITEHADRYKRLLGRRRNFVLHAVVAIISYMVFGLVAPVVYGFSFRESDDKQLKLVVVAAATLLCILVLAIGKAYVQRPPKPYLKTITTFMILGIMVSGVSYVAGGLVERLLEKLGLFEASSASAPNLLMQEMGSFGSGWASV